MGKPLQYFLCDLFIRLKQTLKAFCFHTLTLVRREDKVNSVFINGFKPLLAKKAMREIIEPHFLNCDCKLKGFFP